LFHESLEGALKRSKRSGEPVAVLCLDLDHFKTVNDTLGHLVGDALLREVAGRLTRCARESDVVARLGGDEFAIIQIGGDQPLGATSLAERVIDAIGTQVDIDGHSLMIGTSIGIAVAPTDAKDAEELLKKADVALYRAKEEGRGVYRFFEPGMDERMHARRALETDLRQALGKDEFRLVFQPLVNVGRRAVAGFEALLRWEHPRRGTVPPSEFISLAEDTGLITQIGSWVLREACRTAVTWPAGTRLAVNLSPVQFRNNSLVLDVASALGASGLSPARLELEVTETVMLNDTESTLETLRQLKELGVSISMDDFGTGYSSLSYLRKFPFDKIKIDQSFVRTIADSQESLAIIRAILGLGDSLGMIATAEGVETADQLALLRVQGCKEMQGYYFSRPVAAQQIPALISSLHATFDAQFQDNAPPEAIALARAAS
jgi:diguanylate cyclase (GGDEF)-like protein